MKEESRLLKSNSRYLIKFPFKAGYTYTFALNGLVKSSTPIASTLTLNANMLSTLGNLNPSDAQNCSTIDLSHTTPIQSSLVTSVGITSPYATNYSFSTPLTPSVNNQYISLIASTAGLSLDTLYINSITITETAPSPQYTLSPTTINIPCQSTTPQTFTFTHTNSINGAVQFNWHFPANSGWKYNNAVAPTTISTSATSLTLTPDGTKAPSDITIDETYNGNIVNTFNVSITSTQPQYAISGDSHLCTSQIYSVDNLIDGATVVWSASPSSAVSLTTSDNVVTVTSINGTNFVLSANILTACGSTIISKSISVTDPSSLNFTGYTVSKDGPCPAYNAPVSIGITKDGVSLNSSQTIAAVDWQVYPTGTAPYTINWNEGSFSSETVDKAGFKLTYSSTSTTPITFRFRLQNVCGTWSNWSPGYAIFTESNCTTGFSAFSISPNPTYSSIKISSLQKSSQKANIQSYKLYDASGKLIRTSNVKEGENIDVSKLSKGIYYLDILTDKGVEKHKFLKQ